MQAIILTSVLAVSISALPSPPISPFNETAQDGHPDLGVNVPNWTDLKCYHSPLDLPACDAILPSLRNMWNLPRTELNWHWVMPRRLAPLPSTADTGPGTLPVAVGPDGGCQANLVILDMEESDRFDTEVVVRGAQRVLNECFSRGMVGTVVIGPRRLVSMRIGLQFGVGHGLGENIH